MAKNKDKQEQAPATTGRERPEADSDGLWTTRQAATYLGVQKSSFDAAIKRIDYLKEGTVRDTYPGLQIPRVRISPDLVLRFESERDSSGRGASRGGMKRFAALLTDEEAQAASRAVSEALGRDVEFARLYRGKKNADGTESDGDEGEANGLEVHESEDEFATHRLA